MWLGYVGNSRPTLTEFRCGAVYFGPTEILMFLQNAWFIILILGMTLQENIQSG